MSTEAEMPSMPPPPAGDVPQDQLPKPANKHFPCSTEEVDTWVTRINTISGAISDFLSLIHI